MAICRVGGTLGDVLQMNVTGTINPNLTVPGKPTVFNGKPYNGPGSGTWTFDPNHREVRFKSIEDAQITGPLPPHLRQQRRAGRQFGDHARWHRSPNEKLQFRDGTVGTVLYQTTLTPILSVRVLGGAGNDTVTIDDINGLPSFAVACRRPPVSATSVHQRHRSRPPAPEFFFDAGGGTNTLNLNLNRASTQQQWAFGTGTGAGTLEGEIQSTNAPTGLNAYVRNVSEVNRTSIGATPGGLTVFGDDLTNISITDNTGRDPRCGRRLYVVRLQRQQLHALVVNALAGDDTIDLISFGQVRTTTGRSR